MLGIITDLINLVTVAKPSQYHTKIIEFSGKDQKEPVDYTSIPYSFIFRACKGPAKDCFC
jgi:hypothetical protein